MKSKSTKIYKTTLDVLVATVREEEMINETATFEGPEENEILV
jgi:hypothetical protein